MQCQNATREKALVNHWFTLTFRTGSLEVLRRTEMSSDVIYAIILSL